MRVVPSCVAVCLLVIALNVKTFAQMTPYPRGVGRNGTSLPRPVPDTKGDKQKSTAEPLPSFAGTVRGIDSKGLTIERPDANTLQFNCTRKTTYYDGSKKIKASAIKPGAQVSVEAKRALDGTLDAVNVRLEREKSS